MNKDQVEGKLQDIGGKIQEEAGKLIGSKEHEVKGLQHQAEGKNAERRWRREGGGTQFEKCRQERVNQGPGADSQLKDPGKPAGEPLDVIEASAGGPSTTTSTAEWRTLRRGHGEPRA